MRMHSAALRQVILGLSAFALIQGIEGALHAEMTIQDIIENVRRNEALYDNVDVKMDYEYQLARGMMPVMPNGSVPGRMHTLTHYVSQNGMFRLDEEGESQTAEGPRNEDRVRAFDGEITRLYVQKAVGNIIMGRADDDMRIQPHIILLRPMFEARVPLSVFLSGHDAVRAHPLNQLPEWAELVASYQGMTEFEGLSCHAVAIVMYRAGEPVHRHELLLAEERNYLPVRRHAYKFHLSKDTPVAEGIVTDLREISPGIWYPYEARITTSTWTMSFTCESVSLEPNYPRSYFSDVDFPNEVSKACYQTLAVRWEDEPPSNAVAWAATTGCLLPPLAMLVWGRGGLRLVGLCVLATFDGAICASIADRNIIGSRYFLFANALLLCELPPLLLGVAPRWGFPAPRNSTHFVLPPADAE